ncbi:hypothetical protein CHELA20_50913 [Hyphomicrobiales bacterium]|nr:hypothetical protein CHELA20_50913 [Hyphomicrobiales bacterium]CAH1675387.1 hypothetical protein CHELA41_24100 [Hyphomicrobiales bacterium]
MGKKPSSASDLAKLLSRAAAERDAARQRLDRLRKSDAEVVLDDDRWAKNGQELADAEREIARLDLVISKLQEQHGSAQQAEADIKRRRLYDAAEAHAAKVAADVPARLAELGKLAVGLVRDIAEADAEVVAANLNLPDGADPIDTVEQRSRWTAGLPKIQTESRLIAWTFEDAVDPLPEHIASAIEADSTNPDAGWWIDPTTVVGQAEAQWRGRPPYPGTRRRCVRRHLRRVETIDSVLPIVPTPLAEAIRVPGLRPGLPDAWLFEGRGYVEPADVLRRLAELEAERRAAVPLKNERSGRVLVHFEPVSDTTDADQRFAEAAE